MHKRFHELRGVLALLAVVLPAATALAAEGGAPMESAHVDVSNIASLQRGARNFINYCSGCHSAKYVRFNSIGRDLGLTEDELINNLMFNADKTFETIEVNMPAADAKRWFGRTPPDLSLMARARGADYIYNFLRSFYLDADRPTGVNNAVLAGTSMPNVLWELQGYQEAEFEQVKAEGSNAVMSHFAGFKPATAGILSPEEYDAFVRDTVNFLAYISEPIRGTRRVMGVWVLIFLTFFGIVAYMLKKQIWKDVS